MLRRTLAALGRSYGVYLTRDLLDEVIQETWLRLLQNDRRALRGCRGGTEATILTYLRRVARSALVDWLRARAALKRGALVEIGADLEAGLEEDAEAVELPSRVSDPADAIYAQQLRCRFRRECRGVARPGGTGLRDTWITERMVVDGWNPQEAADVVKLAPATVATVVGPHAPGAPATGSGDARAAQFPAVTPRHGEGGNRRSDRSRSHSERKLCHNGQLSSLPGDHRSWTRRQNIDPYAWAAR